MAPKEGDYKLPAQDTQKVRRNFPGYEEKQYYTLDEIRAGDGMESKGSRSGGTTDTDLITHTQEGAEHHSYTPIYQKKGPTMRPFKTNSPRTVEN